MMIRPSRLWSRVRSNFAGLFRLDDCRRELEARRRARTTRLGVEPLEPREVPARYLVDVTGPFKVSGGTHVISLAATPTFGTFDAATPAEAATAALGLFSGGVDMTWQGKSASYPFVASEVGSKADHKAYALYQPNATGTPNLWQLGLEDLQAPNMQSLGVDWDYNDQYWKLNVTEVTAPVISIAAGTSASEVGQTPGTFVLTRTDDGVPFSSPLTVTLNYGGGTAPAALGPDYSAPTTVTFAANSATATITATPLRDSRVEGTETIRVTVGAGSGYLAHPTIGQRQASIGLADDPPIVSVERIGDASEIGSAAGRFRFTRTGGNPSLALTVSYTLGGTAVAADYGLSPTGTLQFAANKTTADLVLTPVADNLVEGPETVVVTVNTNTTLNTNGHIATGGPATLTITDNPPTVKVEAGASTVAETGSTFLRFTRTGSTADSLTAAFTAGGKAAPGSDYFDLPSTVTFPVGQSVVEIPLTPIADGKSEENEPVVVAVTAGSGYVPTGSPATVVITDQTPLVIRPLDDRSSLEGDTVSFPVLVDSRVSGSLTYSATGLPTGVWVDRNTGSVSGAVGYGTASATPYAVTISVTNGIATATRSFAWTVERIALDPIDDVTSTLGVEAELSPSLANPSAGPVSFDVTGLPAGLSYDPATGAISGVPTALGSSTVTVTATAGSFVDSVSFEWTVVALQVSSPGDQTGFVTDEVELAFDAELPTGAAPVVWSAMGLPAGLTIEPGSGVVSGTIAAADLSSPYSVTVTATSGSLVGTASFSWTIADLVVYSPDDQTSLVGEEVDLFADWYMVSDTPLTWTATGLPPGLLLDPATGDISGTVAATASTTTPYTVTLTAVAGSRSSSVTFEWTIEAFALSVPDAPLSAVGDVVTLAVELTNPLQRPVVFDATGLPPGLGIDVRSGVISGTVAASAAVGGPFAVTVSATVDGVTRSVSFPWLVSNGQVTVTVPGSQTDPEGATVSVATSAAAPSGASLSFSATGLPDGLDIDSETGAITGVISGTAAGTYEVSVWAETNRGESGLARFSWVVTAANLAPELDPVDTQESLLGSVISLWTFGQDANDDTLTYSATGLPSGLDIDPLTGRIAGTIAAGAVSATPYAVTVTVSDGTASSSTSFDWFVRDLVLADPGDQFSEEGDAVTLTLAVTRADSGATVAYTATGLPPGLTLNESTGVVTGTVADLAAQGGPYTVVFTVTANGSTSSKTVQWTVSHIEIVSPGDQSNTQGDLVSVTVYGFDPADELLSWSASGLPAGLAIDLETGEISGVLAVTSGSTTPYAVSVTAADATGHSASTTFNWSVNAIALSTAFYEFNLPGDVVEVPLEATDGSGGMLAFSATGLPDGLSIHSTTGTISGTVAPTAARAESYAVTVFATNGSQTASSTITWVVADLEILGPAGVVVGEGIAISVPVELATTLPSGTVTFSATGLPTGLTINPSTGVVSGTPAAGTGRPEVYRTTVIASTATKQVSATIDWTVVALSVSNPGTQLTGVGEWASVTVTATVVDGVAPTFSATGLPPGLSIDEDTGAITGVVDAETQPGVYATTVTVTTLGGSASASFDWRVRGFTVEYPGVQTSHEGDLVDFSLTFSNLSGTSLTWSAEGLPTGLAINTATGAISGTVAEFASNDGPYTVVVTATDGTDAQSVVFTWDVVYLSLVNPGEQTTVLDQSVTLAMAGEGNPSTATYAATGLPAGLDIDATGVISGTVTGSATVYEVTITVTDGGHETSVTFDWVTTDVAIGAIETQYARAESAVEIPLAVTVASGAIVTYEIEGHPLGVSVIDGVLTGTLAATAGRTDPYRVTVTATVGDSVASTTFDWFVSDNGVEVTAPDSPTTRAGSLASYDVVASFASGSPLTFRAEGLPDGLYINDETGHLFGTVDLDVEPGSYLVDVRVDSADGQSGHVSFLWTIEAANRAPTLPALSDRSTRDGTVVSVSAAASDADGDALEYSATGLPPGLSIDSASGLISGTLSDAAPAPAFTADYTVEVSVFDGEATTTATFVWTVSRLELPAISAQTNREGDGVSLSVVAQAPSGASVAYSATGLPPGLSIGSSSGVISGTVANLASNGGTYSVTVTATAGELTTTTTFDWTITFITLVNPGDQSTVAGQSVALGIPATAPSGILTYSATGLPAGLSIVPSTGVIRGTVAGTAVSSTPYAVVVTATAAGRTTSVSFDWTVVATDLTNPGDQFSAAGETVSLAIASMSAPSASTVFSATGLPSGLDIDANGTISGTIDPTAASTSPYTVTVSAVSGSTSTSEQFTWSVTDNAVTVTDPGDQTTAAGSAVSLAIVTTNPAGLPLTFTAQNLPPGLFLIETTGEIVGTIGDSVRDTYSVQVWAADSAGHSGLAEFTWTVTGDDRAPTVTNPGSQTSTVGTPVTLPILAIDADGDSITYSASGLPDGLSINSSTGVISGTPTTATTEPLSVTVWVSSSSQSESATFTWSVVSDDGNGTGTGLLGIYYDTDQFTDVRVVRVDPTVNFDWGAGSPDASIGADTFSIRWVGEVEATTTGEVTFKVNADDGARIWVGDLAGAVPGEIPNGAASQTLAVVAGQKYDIVVQYREDTGNASASLSWLWAGHTEELIPTARLYSPLVTIATDQADYVEGQVATLEGYYFGVGSEADQSVRVTWGDGSVDDLVEAVDLGGVYYFQAVHRYNDDRQPGDGAVGNGTASDKNRVSVEITTAAAPVFTLADQTTVTIHNQAPTKVFVEVRSPAAGQAITDGVVIIQPHITDASLAINNGLVPLDRFERTVNWGDGKDAEVLGFNDERQSIHHDYNLVGELLPNEVDRIVEKLVTVTVADDDQPDVTVSGTAKVSVLLKAPSLGAPDIRRLDASGIETVTEGQIVSISGSIDAAGPALWNFVQINWGDGTTVDNKGETESKVSITKDEFGRVKYTAQHVYQNNGAAQGGGFQPYTVTITAAAEGFPNNKLVTTTTANIDNALPTKLETKFSTVAPAGGGITKSVQISGGTFKDLGVLDSHRVVIDWGDKASNGTPNQTVIELPVGVTVFSPATHEYTADGKYLVTVSVYDNDSPNQTLARNSYSFVLVSSDILKNVYDTSLASVNQGIAQTIFSFAGQVVDFVSAKANSFVKDVTAFVDQLRELESQLGKLFGTNLPKFLDAMLEKPGTFISNFFDAAQIAFGDLFKPDNLLDTAKGLMLSYLSKKGGFNIVEADIPTGDEWKSPEVVGGFVLKLLGITWDDLVAKVTVAVGPDNLAAAMQIYDFIAGQIGEGKTAQAGIIGALQFEKADSAINKILGAVGDDTLSKEITRLINDGLSGQKLSESAINAAIDAAVKKIPGLIVDNLLPLLNPAGLFGAGFTAIKKLIATTSWLATNLKEVTEAVGVMNAFAENIPSLLSDQWKTPLPSGKTPQQTVVDSIKTAVKAIGPTLIDFVAALSGAGKVAEAAGTAVKDLHKTIDGKLDALFKPVATAGQRLVEKLMPKGADGKPIGGADDYKGLVGNIVTWKVGTETHRLWTTVDAAGKATTWVASDKMSDDKYLLSQKEIWEKDTTYGPIVKDAIEKHRPALSKEAQEAGKEQSDVTKLQVQLTQLRDNTPLAKRDTAYFKKADELEAKIKVELGQLKKEAGEYTGLTGTTAKPGAEPVACDKLMNACFDAGTPLRTPWGSMNIEDIRAGDRVLSRDENDPNGAVTAKVVEEVFVRLAPVWEVLIAGRVIGTTQEHPFYVWEKGWTAVREMRAGDTLLCEDGVWRCVDGIRDTGECRTVYNLRVADWHTYFVGAEEWGFSVWAHNLYTAEVNSIIKDLVARSTGGPSGSGFSSEAGRTGARGKWATRTYLDEHLQAMLDRYYPGVANRDQIVRCAGSRILALPEISRPPDVSRFEPQQIERYRPESSAIPTGLIVPAFQQYTLTRNGVVYKPVTADLNKGGWEVRLGDALGDRSGQRAKGVYVIRDTVTGRIYKVGKADSTSLVGRLESYAADFVTNGYSQGIRITAEVYKLPTGVFDAERVLRGAIVDDKWDLSPNSKAADGSFDEVKPAGFGGWTGGHV